MEGDKMDPRSRLIIILGASALILGSAAVVTKAATSNANTELALFKHCQQLGPKDEVNCACNTALSDNTAFAFEAFSRLYKDDENLGITACAALALVTIPDDRNHEPPIEASPQ